MPIQQKEVYASMWMNLSTSKQESIIKAAVSKIDEFKSYCFDSETFYNDSTNSKQLNSLNSLERIFKLLLSLNNSCTSDTTEFKSIYFKKIIEIKKNMGSSNFIWSSIACNLKDSFTIEHFFMNIMTYQLDLLYFKTFVISELEVDSTDEKKKTRKKKNKKKKIKESDCCEKHSEFTTDAGINGRDDGDSNSKKDYTNDTEFLYNNQKDHRVNKKYEDEKSVKEKQTPNPNITHIIQENKYNNTDASSKDDETLDNYFYENNPLFDDIESNIRKKSSMNEVFCETSDVHELEKINQTYLETKNYEPLFQGDKFHIKEARKPTNFFINTVEENKSSEFKKLETLPDKHQDNVPKIYNMYPNVNMKPYYNNNSNVEYEYACHDFNLKHILNNIDGKSDDRQLLSPLLNKEFDKTMEAEVIEHNRSNSHDISISTNAESKLKKFKREDQSEEINTYFSKKKIIKEDYESEDDYTSEIAEFKPKKISANYDYSKNKSTEYNKVINNNNSKVMPSKLPNSNLVLNDLNKIDGKPKKPKLKKVNNNKKVVRDKEGQGIIDKNKNKNHKVQPNDKEKQAIQDFKQNNKVSLQVVKPETNASIKAISYWDDEPFVNINGSNNNNSKETYKMLLLSKQESDNHSINNVRKEGNKDKFKLKKKGNGNDKQSQLRKKQNINASTTIQRNDHKSKKNTPLPEKHDMNDSIGINVENNENELSELKVKENLKVHFNKIMDYKIDEIITQLENHTQKLELGRKMIQSRINTIVKKTFNTETVYIQEYGSYATRLLTPYSDMDLSIQGCLMLEREQAIEMLQVLCDNLKLFGFIKNATPILTAIVPVIKLEADPSIEFEESEVVPEAMSIKVDIIVDLMDAFNPISTPLRTTDYIKYCISNYPSFYKNILFLKFALNCNDFTNAYKGGLNAYGLCILYVAYLEVYQLEKSTDHFELLRGFLKFLVMHFNPETQAVYFGTAFR